MLRIVNGDLLKAKEGYILHQVNCQGAMNSGVAKQIRAKYPNVYREYKLLCDKKEEKEKLLGHAQFIVTEDYKTVINLFGQVNFGRGTRQTNYRGFMFAMLKVLSLVEGDIALPYKIGSDRGGADWKMIETFLRAIAEDFKYNIVVYNMKNKIKRIVGTIVTLVSLSYILMLIMLTEDVNELSLLSIIIYFVTAVNYILRRIMMEFNVKILKWFILLDWEDDIHSTICFVTSICISSILMIIGGW